MAGANQSLVRGARGRSLRCTVGLVCRVAECSRCSVQALYLQCFDTVGWADKEPLNGCVCSVQAKGSSMPLLGNTHDEDMKLIAELTLYRLQLVCKPTPSPPLKYVVRRSNFSRATPYQHGY